MEEKLRLIAWLVSVVYSSIPLFWFAIHPFADSSRRMHRSPYLLLLPIWCVIILLVAGITWPWHAILLYSSPWMLLPASIFFMYGLGTYTRISSKFGTHKLTGEAELRPDEHDQQLVTTGLHARMRHPIYIAHLSNLAAWALGSGLWISFILFGLSVLFTFPWMIWMEERELEKRFGESFRAYKARVPIIPTPRLRSADIQNEQI